MKVAAIALLLAASVASSGVDAISFRNLVGRKSVVDVIVDDAEGGRAGDNNNKGERELQSGCNQDTPKKWHPTYAAGWTNGYCQYTQDCNSPSYSTELSCCQQAYRGQVSGYCLGRLPSPPTGSPTETGGLSVYYPDYRLSWPDGRCINDRPMPTGRPTYDSMLSCCKAAYRGQISGTCLSSLPSPPTGSPTNAAFEADFWYPEYEKAWDTAGCSNKLPLPYNNVNDRPNYETQLACCNAAYGGQMSGVCLSQLPTPPTGSPTNSDFEADFWYPDYDTPWDDAGCSNMLPLPFNNRNDRPNYDTQLACCKGAYGGQMSGKCLSMLPSPPTGSPTEGGGLSVFYPDYTRGFTEGKCINDRPMPSGRPTYATEESCCAQAYRSQTSNYCMCEAVGVCYACSCGTDADRAMAGGCPELTCS